MDAPHDFRRHFLDCPLIAIIRGVVPDEVEGIGDALFEAGFRIIEVPLNSPEPLRSIERLARRYGDSALIGAGTVLQPEQVASVADAVGASLSPPTLMRQSSRRLSRRG
jgi:2-dehydro-3-deoxyphosphogalactonate aldolase